MLQNKYHKINSYTKILSPSSIIQMIKKKDIKSQQHKKVKILKAPRLTPEEAQDVYKICNRDVVYGNGMENVELGNDYVMGRVIKTKKRRVTRKWK